MGLWHGVEFYENEKLVGEREFLRPKVIIMSCYDVGNQDGGKILSTLGGIKSREKLIIPYFLFFFWQVLKDASRIDYDWYLLFNLKMAWISDFDFLINRSYMIAWIGVGFALISSILFSCAAICLRREREKEEAVNMQYLMPGI